MARQGWGTGKWGNFKWGGEEEEIFTPVTNIDLKITPSTTSIKRQRIEDFDLTIILEPTSEYARGLVANVTLALSPSYSDITPDYQVNINDISLTLLPSYILTVIPVAEQTPLTLLPSCDVVAVPSINIDLTLTPSYESLQQENTVNSDLRLSLLSGYTSLIPDYVVSLNDLNLIFIPSCEVYGWSCQGRVTSNFSCNGRDSADWSLRTRLNHGSVDFTETGRDSESWQCVPRQTTEYSEVAR